MSFRRRTPLAMAAAAALVFGGVATGAHAQAWNYPSFQRPHISPREFSVAIADGDAFGTSILFQWREPVGLRTQLGFDFGLADPDFGDTRILVFGQFGYQLLTESADMPLAVLFTAGLGAAFGDDPNIFRIPIGVAIGHRFPLEGQLAITPYIHPKLWIDFCGEDCFGPGDNSDIGIGFDIGADFEFSPRLSMRLAASFGGSDLTDDESAFGIALAWKPGVMAGRRR